MACCVRIAGGDNGKTNGLKQRKIKSAAHASMLRSLASNLIQIHLVTTDLFHTEIQIDMDSCGKV
jgi:hypothetical protein